MKKLDPGTSLKVGGHDVEIVKYLAEGGFAHIYTVKYTPIEDEREIGVLKRVIVKSKADLNLLRKEVEAMKQLCTSDYVVKLYDSNAQKLEDGTYEVLLLMEYCPNGSLLDYMNSHLKTKLNFEQITKIMYQVSVGVYSMHKLNLIHRDLKIENVLIDVDHNFKLADFGSSSAYIHPPRSQDEFEYISNDIIHNTTPQYRAPEMIDLYRNIPIDNKSDIWALGVLLYKLLYYTTPFETQGNLAILHGYFQFPAHPKYSSKLKNLIIIMLQVNPQLRPNIYQVIHEICKISEKPLTVKDFYGAGPYDFEAYAAYQQQLQIEQQKQQQQLQLQHQQQQQQYLQQQKVLEEQLLAQQEDEKKRKVLVLQQQAESQPELLQPQKETAKTDGLDDQALIGEKTKESILNARPLELTRSSKSSVGDLKSLGNEFGDGEDDDAKELLDADSSLLQDLGDVEERFPDIERLDEDIAGQKFIDLKDDETNKSTAVTSSSVSRTASSKSKTTTVDGEKEVKATIEVNEGTSSLGLKLAHTEAWAVPNQQDNVKDLEVDGVFHKENTLETSQLSENRPETSHNPPFTAGAKSNTFDGLFEFEASKRSTPVPRDDSIKRASNPEAPYPTDSFASYASPVSKNPFPVKTTNPFPHTSQTTYGSPSYVYDQRVKPESSGKNPWAQYTQSAQQQAFAFQQQQAFAFQQQQALAYHQQQQHSQQQVPQNQPPYPQAAYYQQTTVKVPQQASYGYRLQTQSQLQQYQTYQPDQQVKSQTAQKLPQEIQTETESANMLRDTSNNVRSPVIIVSQEEKLIDLDVKSKAKPRPQLNLDLLDMEFSGTKLSRKSQARSSISSQTVEKSDSNVVEIEKDDTDTDTDSEGELKVQEMQVPKSRTTSKSSQNSAPFTQSNKSSSTLSQERKSSELKRLNLDFEELDLDKEKRIGDDEMDEPRHSRRSVSLRRSSSKRNSHERSRSRSRIPVEEKKSEKRKSFLGL